jgi:sigma-B regulation protein RsbU (phosphoserine phosphatase)
MAAMSLPARKVGGDFYDFIRLEDGRIAIVVADVSGKGVAAAILTATIRASVRMETHLGGRHGVAGVVGAVNRWTCRDASNNMFATMFYGVLNPGDMSFEFTNAGHVYPVIFRANGDIIPLEAGGCFLGIMEMVDYQSDFVTFAPGDMLVIYTDGITDSHNADDEVFGLDRLMEVARNNRGKSAVEVRDSIHTATLQFRGQHEQFDDLTLLVAKF